MYALRWHHYWHIPAKVSGFETVTCAHAHVLCMPKLQCLRHCLVPHPSILHVAPIAPANSQIHAVRSSSFAESHIVPKPIEGPTCNLCGMCHPSENLRLRICEPVSPGCDTTTRCSSLSRFDMCYYMLQVYYWRQSGGHWR